jgi:DNA-binding HxlR family transcriptional regulator
MKIRENKRPAGGRRPTKRDHKILHFIARWQPVTTPALKARFGMSIDMVRRRLRALRDLGLVGVYSPVSTQPSVYTLTQRGAALAREHYEAATRHLRTKRPGDHANACALAAAHILRDAEHLGVLDRYETERETRRRLGTVRETRVPDAAIRLTRGRSLALEADLGTERASWVARNKGQPYSSYKRAGGTLLGAARWAVLIVTTTARRRNALLSALYDDQDIEEGLFFVKEVATLEAAPLDAWWTARTVSETQAACVAERPVEVMQ